jgi:Fe-S-cluster containining protein
MATTWKGSGKKRRARGTAPQHRNVLSRRDASGRVHLLLQSNNGVRIATGFSGPLFEEPWQDTLALSAANTALRHCGRSPDVAGITAVAREAMDALSKLAAGLIAQANPTVACAAGCDHCCYQSVGVTALEAITIVQYLQTTLDVDGLDAVRTRVHAARERTRGLTRQERYSPDHPCVFLGEGGRCTVYPVRPLVCRAMNSLNADDCRANLRDPERRAEFLEHGKGPDSLLGPFRASHALSAGLQLAGADVYGLDTRPLDLVAAVDELLQHPDAVHQWLTGGAALESAVGSDATTNLQLRALAGMTPKV